jgi:hypothetical protein
MGSKLERESTSIDVALVFQPFAATKCFLLLHKIISEGGLSLLHGWLLLLPHWFPYAFDFLDSSSTNMDRTDGRWISLASPSRVQCPGALLPRRRQRRRPFVVTRAVSGSGGGVEDDDDGEQGGGGGLSREDLERLVGPDDSKFSGLDLKYTVDTHKEGAANFMALFCDPEFFPALHSATKRLINLVMVVQEFMGRNLLAMNEDDSVHTMQHL